MNYYFRALKKYIDFQGVDTRPQYWYFILFHFIFCVFLGIIDSILGFDLFVYLYGLVLFIPSIATAVRRLHDIGKSGWWLLITLIPIIGYIWLIVLLLKKSKTENNKYYIKK